MENFENTTEQLLEKGYQWVMLNEYEESERYLINDKGDVFDTIYERFIMKQFVGGSNKTGKYLGVNMWLPNGRRTVLYVHRLVAFTFLRILPGKEEVNHKDGNKRNNDVSNLEWCSRKENIRHYYNSPLFKKRKAEKQYKKQLWLNA